jgi:hypothetical protein
MINRMTEWKLGAQSEMWNCNVCGDKLYFEEGFSVALVPCDCYGDIKCQCGGLVACSIHGYPYMCKKCGCDFGETFKKNLKAPIMIPMSVTGTLPGSDPGWPPELTEWASNPQWTPPGQASDWQAQWEPAPSQPGPIVQPMTGPAMTVPVKVGNTLYAAVLQSDGTYALPEQLNKVIHPMYTITITPKPKGRRFKYGKDGC